MAWNLPQIAVFVETSRQYGREVLAGIHAWISEHEDWQVLQQDRCLDTSLPAWFAGWKGDGVLFHSVHQTITAAILKMGIPAVMLNQKQASWNLPGPNPPAVFVDSSDTAVKALEYLKRRGFRKFAFCGFGDFAGCQERQQAFLGLLAAHGLPCVSLDLNYDLEAWESHRQVTLHAKGRRNLQQALHDLPMGTAAVCFNDDAALRLMTACREYGIRVPQDLAILGLDNDPLICSLARPGLSSVETNAFAHGYEAARILHDLIADHPVTQLEWPIPVKHVVERGSTEVVASQHPMVRKAVLRIRESALQGLQIKELLADLGVSRNSLDSHFQQDFGQSVYDYLMQHRLEQAAQLLRTTRLSQQEVARRTGFLSASHFHRAFAARYGVTPGNYRMRERGALSRELP